MSTSCIARVENGVVRLPANFAAPEGCEVRVTIPPATSASRPDEESPSKAEPTRPGFLERYARFIGIADDLPSDLAENHDHYLHGHPKR